MINDKQRELCEMLVAQVKQKFPEVELVDIIESPENPAHPWVRLAMPDDEEREIAARELAAEIATEILMDYGYLIIVTSASRFEESVV